MKKPRDTDYLYTTARIRAVEAADSLRDKNEKMLAAHSFGEAAAIFCGNGDAEDINSGNYQKMLDNELVKTYDFVSSMIGDSAIVKIFKYPYDCNNLKLAFKGELCGRDCSDLYYSFGTVTPRELSRAMNERDFSAFPPDTAAAACELCGNAAKGADPQIVDITLDRACLADMTRTAGDFGCEYLSDVIKTKTDSYNILCFIRCIRMKKGADFYRRLTVNGGKVEASVLCDVYDGGIGALAQRLQMTVYSDIAESISKRLDEPGFFSAIERELESLYTSRTGEVKFISFGPEIPISYIINCEKELKNAGIILAGKSVGLDNETIRERLRA